MIPNNSRVRRRMRVWLTTAAINRDGDIGSAGLVKGPMEKRRAGEREGGHGARPVGK